VAEKVYELWLARETENLDLAVFYRRFFAKYEGTRKEDTTKIIKWIKEAEKDVEEERRAAAAALRSNSSVIKKTSTSTYNPSRPKSQANSLQTPQRRSSAAQPTSSFSSKTPATRPNVPARPIWIQSDSDDPDGEASDSTRSKPNTIQSRTSSSASFRGHRLSQHPMRGFNNQTSTNLPAAPRNQPRQPTPNQSSTTRTQVVAQSRGPARNIVGGSRSTVSRSNHAETPNRPLPKTPSNTRNRDNLVLDTPPGNFSQRRHSQRPGSIRGLERPSGGVTAVPTRSRPQGVAVSKASLQDDGIEVSGGIFSKTFAEIQNQHYPKSSQQSQTGATNSLLPRVPSSVDRSRSTRGVAKDHIQTPRTKPIEPDQGLRKQSYAVCESQQASSTELDTHVPFGLVVERHRGRINGRSEPIARQSPPEALTKQHRAVGESFSKVQNQAIRKYPLKHNTESQRTRHFDHAAAHHMQGLPIEHSEKDPSVLDSSHGTQNQKVLSLSQGGACNDPGFMQESVRRSQSPELVEAAVKYRDRRDSLSRPQTRDFSNIAPPSRSHAKNDRLELSKKRLGSEESSARRSSRPSMSNGAGRDILSRRQTSSQARLDSQENELPRDRNSSSTYHDQDRYVRNGHGYISGSGRGRVWSADDHDRRDRRNSEGHGLYNSYRPAGNQGSDRC
jgi:hypothetical protein